ncbi:hypothetical protein AHF37_09519 [Paragonimus kellicotti]|nr:hypothetical protein AHF37_09519 [Paragonimus kellicotti]
MNSPTTLLMRQATNQSNAMSTFDWTSPTPRSELLQRSGKGSQQNSICNMSDEKQVCRVFAIDLSGEREPFTTEAGERYLQTPGLIQCDLLWCSIYRGSYAQQLANRPAMLRTVTQRHLTNDSNQRIRSVQWLKLPVLDCDLPPRTSPSPEQEQPICWLYFCMCYFRWPMNSDLNWLLYSLVKSGQKQMIHLTLLPWRIRYTYSMDSAWLSLFLSIPLNHRLLIC